MDMLDALRQIKAATEEYKAARKRREDVDYNAVYVWARPVSWTGRRLAVTYEPPERDNPVYSFREPGFYYVPSPSGGVPAYLTLEALEPWEVVTPQQVNNGG